MPQCGRAETQAPAQVFIDVYIPTTSPRRSRSSLSCITQRQAPLKDNEMRCVGRHIGTASSTKHTRHTQRELPKHIKYVSKASKAAHETGVNHLELFRITRSFLLPRAREVLGASLGTHAAGATMHSVGAMILPTLLLLAAVLPGLARPPQRRQRKWAGKQRGTPATEDEASAPILDTAAAEHSVLRGAYCARVTSIPLSLLKYISKHRQSKQHDEQDWRRIWLPR